MSCRCWPTERRGPLFLRNSSTCKTHQIPQQSWTSTPSSPVKKVFLSFSCYCELLVTAAVLQTKVSLYHDVSYNGTHMSVTSHSMADLWLPASWLALTATCIKLLLVPAYRSTDFEVHRHWLATTRSLALDKWYLDETSEWTLDYPPLFAWFERFLSIFAARIDARMVHLKQGLNYASPETIIFQRGSVMVADILLFYSAYRFCKTLKPGRQHLVLVALYFSPGLFIVDHIHFQYNGFLLGILLLSLSFLKEGCDLLGGILFAVLICFKHLFAVAGPLYFVYLLRSYCWGTEFLKRFFLLGSSVILIFGLAFGPFVYLGQMPQLLSRLFPFGRGLCHAYWAPNFWAIYNVWDKVLEILRMKLNPSISPEVTGSLTRGLVGDISRYAVLPQITPAISLLLVLLTMSPCLVRMWRFPNRQDLVKSVVFVYLCAFMFGWHVHEKASLHFIIPLSLLIGESDEDFRDFLFLVAVTTYSLFPLLFEMTEYPVKILLACLYLGFVKWHYAKFNEEKDCNTVGLVQTVFLGGIVVLEIYIQVFHKILFGEKLPFLPLLLVSSYCALGITSIWVKYSLEFLNIFPTSGLKIC